MLETEIERHATGSRYICNPPPMDTDNDTIILVRDLMGEFWDLRGGGWELGGSEPPGAGDWLSLKKGEENYIITNNAEYYDNFVLATEVAKKLNLLNKEDRIMLFSAFVEGKAPTEPEVPF